MRATYTTKSDSPGFLDCPVIVPQAMQHSDGFTLLGFESWEDVNDEKLSAAVTDVAVFKLVRDSRLGFVTND